MIINKYKVISMICCQEYDNHIKSKQYINCIIGDLPTQATCAETDMQRSDTAGEYKNEGHEQIPRSLVTIFWIDDTVFSILTLCHPIKFILVVVTFV